LIDGVSFAKYLGHDDSKISLLPPKNISF